MLSAPSVTNCKEDDPQKYLHSNNWPLLNLTYLRRKPGKQSFQFEMFCLLLHRIAVITSDFTRNSKAVFEVWFLVHHFPSDLFPQYNSIHSMFSLMILTCTLHLCAGHHTL